MKITGIDIGEYRQFKNIKFDFTYPADHPKAGQPLEKVCFIGQSGTGKTTLLKVICNFFEVANDGYQISRNKFSIPYSQHYTTFQNEIAIKAQIGDKKIELSQNNFHKPTDFPELPNHNAVIGGSFDWVQSHKLYDIIKASGKLCLYLDDSAVNHARSLTLDTILKESGNNAYVATSDDIAAKDVKSTEVIAELSESKVLRLDYINTSFIWNYLLNDIDIFNENLRKIASDLVQNRHSFSPNALYDALNKWEQKNPNPKIELANRCLNPILEKLFLEVDTDGTQAPIVIKTQTGTTIPYVFLSTGTKQLLTTSIPIYKTQINEGVVLFDEPERSLFPNIQRILIDYYTSLAPEAQFFFATHSPIIASAFEPCERFILYFDENGEVKCRNGLAPEGDDPNDILRQDFAIEELMLQKGLKAYEEYRELAMQIRAETDEVKKNELIAKRVELGNRYNF